MRDDADLLRAYSDRNSEEAFGELLRRHVDLVYSAALRQVGGDAHFAKDVTQTVFIELARKAKSLSDYESLAGWLYTTACFTAAKVVRTEVRRRAREQEAQTMNELLSDSNVTPDWDRLRPVLDAVMLKLPESDREAVLLRFFSGRSFDQVGAALQLPADTARKRVERALDKLHGLLASRGVTSTAAALALVLTQNAVAAAPTEVTRAVGGAVANSVTGGAGISAQILLMTKIKFGIILAAALPLTAVLWVQRASIAEARADIALLRGRSRQISAAIKETEGQMTATQLETAQATAKMKTSVEVDTEPLPRVPASVVTIRRELDTTYAPLLRGLRISAGELEVMRELLVERELARADVVMFTKRRIDQLPYAEQIELVEVGTTSIDARIRTFLGDARFDYYRNYQRTFPWRKVYADLNGVGSSVGYLSYFEDSEVDQLAVLARAANPGLSPQAEIKTHRGSGEVPIPDAVVANAGSLLTTAQLEKLKLLKAATDANSKMRQLVWAAYVRSAATTGRGGSNREN